MIYRAAKPGTYANHVMPRGRVMPGWRIHGIKEGERVCDTTQLAVHLDQTSLSVAMEFMILREGFDDVGMKKLTL